MALKRKDKRDVCLLSSIHNEDVHNKKEEEKRQPAACINFSNMVGIIDLSDQYIVMYSTARK
jgi:hypothetical protein